jgi:hypothetical protein
MKKSRWTKEWQKAYDGGWVLLITWNGAEQGEIDCYGKTKADAITDFKNKLALLGAFAEKLK